MGEGGRHIAAPVALVPALEGLYLKGGLPLLALVGYFLGAAMSAH